MIYVLSGNPSLYAVIAVTYPAGSICTCGGKTARDTSGYALFNVKAGTYTVECHTSDNSKSKSTSVTVTDSDAGKAINVTLTYVLVLYNAGDQCTAVTGGYSARNSGVTFDSSVINVSVDNGGTATWAWTNRAIDVTGYSTLRVYARPTNQYYRTMRFGVASSVSTSSCNFTASSDGYITGDAMNQCDISGVSGNMYIVPCYGGTLGTSGGLWAAITKVEME